jgi:hypothetical protein
MEHFRTEIEVNKQAFTFAHTHRILLIGSCFTEHIGRRLQDGKFNARINPFGIVYNPASIARCLDRLLDGDRPFLPEELSQHQDLWHTWEHHGHFSGTDPAETLARINAAYRADAAFLADCDRLILSLGTAVTYRLLPDGPVAANCHKAPANLFEKKRLTVTEIVAPLYEVLHRMQTQRPELRIVLTVSPVRHWRDGAVENQRSKAALALACAELESLLPGTVYFPAYELLLDDLRDYRFYDPDMIHPAPVAIDYIWRKFAAAFFDAATSQVLEQIGKIAAAAAHRPFRPDAPRHREFQRRQLEAIAGLEAEFPYLDFSREKKAFEIVTT